jgi:hypothetical protein
MSLTLTRQTFVKQSISLRRDQLAAAKRVVEEDRHGNLSRLIQDLLEEELRRRDGLNWASELESRERAA